MYNVRLLTCFNNTHGQAGLFIAYAIAQPLGCAIEHFCHRIQAYLNYDTSWVHTGNQRSHINTRAGALAPRCCIRRVFNMSPCTCLDNACTFFLAGLQLSVQIAISLSESPTRICNRKLRMLETTSN